eukprot:9319919-Pyramimonas_sp.AAC.1
MVNRTVSVEPSRCMRRAQVASSEAVGAGGLGYCQDGASRGDDGSACRVRHGHMVSAKNWYEN